MPQYHILVPTSLSLLFLNTVSSQLLPLDFHYYFEIDEKAISIFNTYVPTGKL